MEFKGKVAIVTGGASGIGQACSLEFAQRHATVAIVDRNRKAGEETLSELRGRGGAGDFFCTDVSVAAEVERLIRDIVAKFGGVDILVNNAGIQRYGTVTTTTEEAWDEVLNSNLRSAFLMSKYAIPEMLKRGGGSIINTGSVQSVMALGNSVHYVTSKHALLGLTRSIALDYGKQNIRANCVLPGAIDTPMLRWSASRDPHPERVLDACDRLHLRGKMGHPEEVAHVVAFLASDLASFVTGSAIPVEGGALIAFGGTAFQESGTGAAKS